MTETLPRPWPGPIPLLPVANRGSVLAVGADALRDRLSSAFQSIDRIEAATPAMGLRHRSNVFTIGSLRCCVAATDPVRFSAAPQAEPCLVVPLRGRLRFWVDGRECLATAGRTAVFCSGEALQAEFGPCNALFLTPDPERLQVAVRLASTNRSSTHRHGELELATSRAAGFSLSRESSVTPTLESLLEDAGRALEQPEWVSLLDLEDLFYRWMAELLAASLNAGRVNRLPR